MVITIPEKSYKQDKLTTLLMQAFKEIEPRGLKSLCSVASAAVKPKDLSQRSILVILRYSRGKKGGHNLSFSGRAVEAEPIPSDLHRMGHAD